MYCTEKAALVCLANRGYLQQFMAKQQETKSDLASDSGVYPFCLNRSLSEEQRDAELKGDLVECAQTRYYDDRPILTPHYRVLERRRSNSSCSRCYLPSPREYDDQNPSVDARLLETTQMRNNVEVFSSEYSVDQAAGDGNSSADAQLWPPEPIYFDKFSLDPRELYSVVTQHDIGAVDIATVSLDGYSMVFKLYPKLDNRATQVTFCAEVIPLSDNQCHNLTAIKVEAEIRDPLRDLNDRESLMGSCARDHRSIGCKSAGFNIFLRNLMSHCRLFYSCRKCEHLDLYVRCWERFNGSYLNADSGVDITAA